MRDPAGQKGEQACILGIPADFSSRNRDLSGARAPLTDAGTGLPCITSRARDTRQRLTPTRSSSSSQSSSSRSMGQAYKFTVTCGVRRSHLACGSGAAPVPCDSMQRIVVLNPKGGSGKTTIAVNLAGYFASRQQRPVLMDYDPQGSSGRWVSKRDPARPKVHLISAHERDPRVTRTFQLRPPPGATHIILDTPAAVNGQTMIELTRQADKILVPVLPSDIDIHACFALHPRSAAGGQDPAPRQSPGRDRQSGEGADAGLPVAAALPGIAGNSRSWRPCATRRTTSARWKPASASTK